MSEEALWYYNCEDCVYTLEVADAIPQTTLKLGLEKVQQFQQQMFWPVLQCMIRGVRIDIQRRAELTKEVQDEVKRRQDFLKEVLGHDLNPNSPKQMHTLFYEDFKMPIQMKRAKKGVPSKPTLDDDALQKLARIEPLLKPIINAIADSRTFDKFLSNFLLRPLSPDGRMRCSYRIGGSESGASAPKTYRLSSAEDAFGDGTNLQTIPSEKSSSVGKAAARGGISMLGDPYQFPNIREIFIPDPGYTWFELDLERADLFVFVWEIDDTLFKDILRRGVDTHLFHSYILDHKEPPPIDELIESHSNYKEHRGRMKTRREFAKKFCHAVDYVGSAKAIAAGISMSVHEVDRARRIYLGAHPKIEPYWKKVEEQVRRFRFVENKLGYRWYIFDRMEAILPEAVAWIPQSTVSIVINKIWMNIFEHLPNIQILMQVHDSLPGQMPTDQVSELLPKLKAESQITVPYPDPLVIPVSIKTSEKSWGDC
jgi:DNA polymerase I